MEKSSSLDEAALHSANPKPRHFQCVSELLKEPGAPNFLATDNDRGEAISIDRYAKAQYHKYRAADAYPFGSGIDPSEGEADATDRVWVAHWRHRESGQFGSYHEFRTLKEVAVFVSRIYSL